MIDVIRRVIESAEGATYVISILQTFPAGVLCADAFAFQVARRVGFQAIHEITRNNMN
ncbi:MAG TPA: hypothetical protein VE961_03360 [Pyrinomonadaceae bacterium]|nr:hypothetical protein [Pyrinomonadaceae bacterium]